MAHFPCKGLLPLRAFSLLPSPSSHLQVIHALAGQLGRDYDSRDVHLLSCLGPTPGGSSAVISVSYSDGSQLRAAQTLCLWAWGPLGPLNGVSMRKLLCLPIFNYPVRHCRARQSSWCSLLPLLASLSLYIQHRDDSDRHCSTQALDHGGLLRLFIKDVGELKYSECLREKLDAQGGFLESDNAEGTDERDSYPDVKWSSLAMKGCPEKRQNPSEERRFEVRKTRGVSSPWVCSVPGLLSMSTMTSLVLPS